MLRCKSPRQWALRSRAAGAVWTASNAASPVVLECEILAAVQVAAEKKIWTLFNRRKTNPTQLLEIVRDSSAFVVSAAAKNPKIKWWKKESVRVWRARKKSKNKFFLCFNPEKNYLRKTKMFNRETFWYQKETFIEVEWAWSLFFIKFKPGQSWKFKFQEVLYGITNRYSYKIMPWKSDWLTDQVIINPENWSNLNFLSKFALSCKRLQFQ